MSKVFFSYSHDDETHRNELEKHLATLKHQGLIESWHDRRLIAGTNVNTEIDANLADSDIVLLLVSASFLASNYCYGIEMQQALQRRKEGVCQVIPVIVRPCDWMNTPLGQLLAVPRDGKAITIWPNYDEAMTDVAQAIRKALPARSAEAARLDPPVASGGFDQPARASAPSTSHPRSSNLRIKAEFSDADKDSFLHETFDYVAQYFEGSLKELQSRHPPIEGRYRRISADLFSVSVYVQGKLKAECGIHLGNGFGTRQGIAYSPNASSTNTFQETLMIEADDFAMYWKPLMGGFRQRDRERLSKEQAAEHLWSMLMDRLQ